MEVTKPESALSRIRKERCKWCAHGLETTGVRGLSHHYLGDGKYVPCTAPSAEQLVEELAGRLAEAETALRQSSGTRMAWHSYATHTLRAAYGGFWRTSMLIHAQKENTDDKD